MVFRTLFVLLLSLPNNTGFGYPQQGESRDSILMVGIKETPPFIIKNPDGTYSGISISLWENVAVKLGLKYEYREYTLDELIVALKQQTIDVCINPLTVTSERVANFDFTQPFFITNLAIAVPRSGSNQ